jgi:geranylgeranyl pyrophosphate synthase
MVGGQGLDDMALENGGERILAALEHVHLRKTGALIRALSAIGGHECRG